MVITMSKLFHVCKKTLWRITKFRVCIYENNKATYWALNCRQSYQDRFVGGIRLKGHIFFGNTFSCYTSLKAFSMVTLI